MPSITFTLEAHLIQFVSLLLFLLIFGLIHLIFKKKIDFKQFMVVYPIIIYTIADKTDLGIWFDNVDSAWHLIPENISAGFPAFFFFREIIDILTFNNSFLLMPLIFGAATIYVFLVWLNQKKINLITLGILIWIFHHEFLYLFSFSRETIIILFSLLFFYFLEKYYYFNSNKNLIAAISFLCLACLSKITGFFLIPFLLLILVKKKINPLYLFPVGFIILFMLFKTNLGENLNVIGENNFISIQLIVDSLQTLIIVFSVWLLVLFEPFFKPENYLWLVNAYALLLIFVVGTTTYFLMTPLMAQTLLRYFIIFLLPLILWVSNSVSVWISNSFHQSNSHKQAT